MSSAAVVRLRRSARFVPVVGAVGSRGWGVIGELVETCGPVHRPVVGPSLERRAAGAIPVLPHRGRLEVDGESIHAGPAAVARGRALRYRVVQPSQRLRRLCQMGSIADAARGQEIGEVLQFGEQVRALGQVGIGRFDAGLGIGLHDGLGCLGRAQREQARQVLRRIGDLSLLPARHADDSAGVAIGLVVEDEEQMVLLEAAVHRCGRETPPGDVVEHLLPAREQAGGHQTRGCAPVDIRLTPASAVVGFVGRHVGLLEEASVHVVDRGDGLGDASGQARAGRQRRERDTATRDQRRDHGPSPVAQRGDAGGPRDGEGDAIGEQRGQRARFLELSRGNGVDRDSHDPPPSVEAFDEADAEAFAYMIDELLDARRLQTGHSGIGQGSESPGGAGHLHTVSTQRRKHAEHPRRSVVRGCRGRRLDPQGPGPDEDGSARSAYGERMELPWVSRFDRCAEERVEPGVAALLRSAHTRVLEWSSEGCWVVTGPSGSHLWLRPPEPEDHSRLALFLGRDASRNAWVAIVTEESAGPAGRSETSGVRPDPRHDLLTRRRMGLRDIGASLPEDEVEAFMTTQALASWHATHSHCPRCGAPTQPVSSGWTRRCPIDGSEHYPRTDPAVIMAVIDPSDRLLLARSPAWPANRRSVLAGFVEPGERLEAAVAREVREEVGLAVRDVRYAGTQPWPFPASLMVGFTARADRHDLSLTDGEIAAAEWYSRAELRSAVADGSLGPPGPLSIARRLIEGWLGEPLRPPVELPFHRQGAHQPPDEAPGSGR